ncbi:MAG: 2-C-methyl-D-erythritol 2,4-cyclodiphosphate synthase [Planctomycetota bacterium]
MENYLVGIGFDIHPMVAGRPLFLGGVKIEFPAGLSGHSDADAVLHSITDALLGAVGCEDIGSHFSDTDKNWKNASSKIFLEKAMEKVKQSGFCVGNVDIIIFASRPPIGVHAQEMRKNIASLLACDTRMVNIKAKTFQGIGYIGKGKAIAAQTIVLLKKSKKRITKRKNSLLK